MSRNYMSFEHFDPDALQFVLGNDRSGKATVIMHYNTQDVSMVTPACVTNWPRVNGDGNFGTMWGPTDVMKAKFTLDLTDAGINDNPNTAFENWAKTMFAIDEKLLDFVNNNQLKILGRKNLTREEVSMLQIRSVRAKYDKHTGALTGHNLQLSAGKYMWDGFGGKVARVINVCDKDGAVVPNGVVAPGDVVAATCFVNQVYTGVGGDKFGIHWSFEDVQVVCQRSRLAQKAEVPAFGAVQYDFAAPYTAAMAMDLGAQFSEPVGA